MCWLGNVCRFAIDGVLEGELFPDWSFHGQDCCQCHNVMIDSKYDELEQSASLEKGFS